MLLSKHDNLFLVLRLLLLFLLATHKIILGPFLEVRIAQVHCMPKTKYTIIFYNLGGYNYNFDLSVVFNKKNQ